jgi:SNF2 family DNA or RNA helicase
MMKLYPFQREAVEKLEKVSSVLIGDDMGLGKTHEAIALDLVRRSWFPNHKLKTLVVAPLSVISAWTKAWVLWAPHL